jgi:hypothetical protein
MEAHNEARPGPAQNRSLNGNRPHGPAVFAMLVLKDGLFILPELEGLDPDRLGVRA